MQIHYPQTANGIYRLSQNDIEEIATSRLKEFFSQNLEYPTPLDTTKYLVDCLGLIIKHVHIGLPEEGILGLIVMGDMAEIIECNTLYELEVVEETYGTVLISTDLLGAKNAARRTYTLVHEAGHKELHGPYFDRRPQSDVRIAQRKGYVACRKVERYKPPVKTELDWMEWQADTFAAAMLMPREVFRDYVRSLLRHAGVFRGYLIKGQRRDEAVYREIIGDITRTFRVSQRAAQIRMTHVGLIKTLSMGW